MIRCTGEPLNVVEQLNQSFRACAGLEFGLPSLSSTCELHHWDSWQALGLVLGSAFERTRHRKR